MLLGATKRHPSLGFAFGITFKSLTFPAQYSLHCTLAVNAPQDRLQVSSVASEVATSTSGATVIRVSFRAFLLAPGDGDRLLQTLHAASPLLAFSTPSGAKMEPIGDSAKQVRRYPHRLYTAAPTLSPAARFPSKQCCRRDVQFTAWCCVFGV